MQWPTGLLFASLCVALPAAAFADASPPASAGDGATAPPAVCTVIDAKKTRVSFDQSVLDWARAFRATVPALGGNDAAQAIGSLDAFKGSTNAMNAIASDPVVTACLARTPGGGDDLAALLTTISPLVQTIGTTRTDVLLMKTPAGIVLDPKAIGKRFGDAVVATKTGAYKLVMDLKAEATADATGGPAPAPEPAVALSDGVTPGTRAASPIASDLAAQHAAVPPSAMHVSDPAQLIVRIERNDCAGLTEAMAPWVARRSARALEAEGLAYSRTCDRDYDRAAALAAYRQAIAAGLHDSFVSGTIAFNSAPAQKAGARALLVKAVAEGSFFAPHLLAYMYANGDGVAKNLATARSFAERGAARGDSLCLEFLGSSDLFGSQRSAQNDRAGIALLERAAAMHDADAIADLGYAYEVGTGVPKDLARSVALLRDAAGRRPPLASRRGELWLQSVKRHRHPGGPGCRLFVHASCGEVRRGGCSYQCLLCLRGGGGDRKGFCRCADVVSQVCRIQGRRGREYARHHVEQRRRRRRRPGAGRTLVSACDP